ncbi:MAG: ComEC/Rec2 family competence protein [Chloroflexi bacterium]|nr:ComEC/Rec2 family competence protein [Chloroflexota bacterium]
MPLIYLSGAWVAGILLGAKFDLPFLLVFLGFVPLPFLFRFHQQKKHIILASLCLIAFFVGALRFQSSLPVVDESSLQFYNDREAVEIKGMVSANPDVRDKITHLQLSAAEIKLGGEWQDIAGTALLFVPRYHVYRYGDVLQVTGKLETPPQLDDFDYRGYLAHQGIYSTMLYPKIELLEEGKGSEALAWVYSLRNRLSQTLSAVLPEPQASLAQGILLGIRSNIPSSIRDAFTHTGTAHILAISGHNLSIIAGILLSIGIWLFGRKRYIYIWLALGLIWLYALLAGMNAPVVRATIMASLFLAAELLGRQRSAFTSLAFAAAVMIGISPQVLWTASFQMSFLAMAGLIFIAPPLMNLGRKAVSAIFGESRKVVPFANVVADSFGVSLGATIAVWPLIAYYFGIVAFIAPIATFLALPALPGIIITSALAGVFGLFVLPVAQVIGWLAWLFLSYMLLVVDGFAQLPAFVEVRSANPILILVYYLVLAFVLRLIANRRKLASPMSRVAASVKSDAGKFLDFVSGLPKKWLIPPLTAAAILVSLAAATMPDNNLRVSFLDVGEGDAILIQTPAHQDILVDGGPAPQAVGLGLGDKMPFWDRTLDLVILTHPHAGHLTGLVEVLQRYEVKQVLSAGLLDNSPIYQEWLGILEEKNIKYTVAQAGQQIDLGEGVMLSVLSPMKTPLTGTDSDIDNNGIVLRLSMGKASFLFAADIWRDAERELVAQRAALSSTVLKVAHHGSETSTTHEFLSVVNPQLAVISVGGGNKFGHPHDDIIRRLSEKVDSGNIYRTDEHGTIEFITDGQRLWVETER